MLLHKIHLLIRTYSTATSSSVQWRNHVKENQLISQITSILLQRHNWIPLLQNLNLSSKLTPSLLLKIVTKTQKSPHICLRFFSWARTNLGFKPDLKFQCTVIRIAAGSGLIQSVRPTLDSLIQDHPASLVVETMIQVCDKGRDSQFDDLSFLIEGYSHKGLFLESLEVYKKMRVHGCTISVRAYNALLDCLQRGSEIRLAWCFYGAMVRDEVMPDRSTWSLLAQILYRNGKIEKIARLLDLGIYNSIMYSLVIDYCSKSGDFGAAFDSLNEMSERKLDPGFATHSSILDGACKFGNDKVLERVMGEMMEKKLLPNSPLSEYDSIIQKLSDLGKTYGADMFFNKACDEKIVLQGATYGCMLRALSKAGRVKEAIGSYRMISEMGFTVKGGSYHAFANVLCIEDPPDEACELLMDIIRKGISPCASDLSKFLTSQCNKRKWRDVEELLDVILEKGLLPDSLSCCSLMMHYCGTRRIDKAIALHNKIEKLHCSLDVTTYNVFLDGLFRGRRVEDAIKVFGYMKELKMVNGSSFIAMIRGLCRIKKLRKAMKIHDEMLKLGLKPAKATYKRLISAFKP
ncbi:hypothetical protein HS088_TW21G01174 [Tripterygium wilfordii]|uniref:Pentatricopeptide repeat-containing protein n=1 Tax=Tripterygium wilfordii TaxID=458696 RepID=A0A7J7C5B4_TRIWF|nr:pentatricopeptide repeat-containing protein At4g21170 [Tripterygium wilfordii]KAF5729017.1 hypothetical protein HS088_TW21G01174 [Tripterygium wilfordii]